MIREPFELEHKLSHRRQNDRVNNKPRSLLRWLTTGYALETPPQLHVHALAEDGDPAMNGEAAAYIGFFQGGEGSGQANDWERVAQALDRDGRYHTPMRAAISKVRASEERSLLADLAANPLYPLDVTRLHGLPDWTAYIVVETLLERLWSVWRDAPLPTRSRISDAQADAESLGVLASG